MIETRVEKHVSFSDFIATESRNVPFSKEDLLQMAIDQVNDEKPLTIITKSTIFIISAESIADFLTAPKARAEAPPKTEPELPV
jgi:hypothetical protein